MTKYSDVVLELFGKLHKQALTTKEIARKLGLPKKGPKYGQLREALQELQREGAIERIKGGRWRMPKASSVTGVLEITRSGFGVVRCDDDPDREIYIPRRSIHTALQGDRVKVALYAERRGRREEGEVVEIVERGESTAIGILKKTGRLYYVVPDNRSVDRDIFIPSDMIGRARPNDKVVVRIESWDSEHASPEGRVIERLGKAGEPAAEFKALARRYKLRLDFPKECLQEAERKSTMIPMDELKTRLDLRDEEVITIDPDDAKDFDDALSLKRLPDGNFELGVHIADVSFYVPEGSALDKEAFRRSTSVYLVDGVIPMLPERLSNDLCSLREGEDRRTYSCIMRLSPAGAVTSYKLVTSVIRNTKRFSYEEAQKIIQGKKSPHARLLQDLHRIAKKLIAKREKEGSLDFDLPEVKFRLDEKGRPLEIIPKPRLDSHRLVEECMLLANRTVARHILKKAGPDHPLPFLYRVHDLPDEEKISELVLFIRSCGYSVNLDPALPKSFQRMLEQVKDKPEAQLIQSLTIRSMAKAAYSAENIGHFGLAFPHYTHFTSPIRRYPDLIVHRLLKKYEKARSPKGMKALAARVAEIAQQTSRMERVAVMAERESIKMKQVEYMATRIGEEYDALVSGVVAYGLFVEIIPYLVEGMVHIRNMTDDQYMYSERQQSLVGKRTRRRFRIGDKVRVRLVAVDKMENKIDFELL